MFERERVPQILWNTAAELNAIEKALLTMIETFSKNVNIVGYQLSIGILPTALGLMVKELEPTWHSSFAVRHVVCPNQSKIHRHRFVTYVAGRWCQTG